MNIYLWQPKFKSNDELNNIYKALSQTETEKINTFKSSSRRQDFAVGRYLLRNICTSTGYSVPDNLSSEVGRKPIVSGLPHFSISHSQGAVAVAVSGASPVGLDIQFESGAKDFMSLVQSYGTEDEIEFLSRYNGDEQRRVFYKIWSLKESYAKATGQGLGQYLKNLKFDFPVCKILKTPGDAVCVFYYLKNEDLHMSLCQLSSLQSVPKLIQVSYFEIANKPQLGFAEANLRKDFEVWTA